ncbi:hypothetical protein [Spirosoma sp.]|uniref:hypothetical protein n=1 Tax=Spirosoma sp. TaxID=1899569 RepID=UPI003B3A6E05
MNDREQKLLEIEKEDLEKDIADDEAILNSASNTSLTPSVDSGASSPTDEITRRGIEDIAARLVRNRQRLAEVNEKLGIEEKEQPGDYSGVIYKGPIVPIIIGIIVLLIGVVWYILY